MAVRHCRFWTIQLHVFNSTIRYNSQQLRSVWKLSVCATSINLYFNMETLEPHCAKKVETLASEAGNTCLCSISINRFVNYIHPALLAELLRRNCYKEQKKREEKRTSTKKRMKNTALNQDEKSVTSQNTVQGCAATISCTSTRSVPVSHPHRQYCIPTTNGAIKLKST